MSDDTPTERFDAPTEPLPRADADHVADSGPATTPAPDGQRRSMLIALLAIAGAILVALIVLIVVLVGNGGSNDAGPTPEFTATESPTPTPTETESPEPSVEPSEEPSEQPSETAAPPPPPPPPSPSFATFTGPNKATCPDTSSSVEIAWNWSSSDAVNAWFGIGTSNAKVAPFESVPTTATYTFNYQCSEASQIYTVTLEDSSGRLTHKTVTISRQ